MFEDVVGNNGARFVVAAAAVAGALALLFVVLWFMRNRASSPFLRGGKNRQPRLAVLDAAAVDTRRRLVLVRRDDVEHLIMIGGPTDIVIESRIIGARPGVDQAAAPLPTTFPATAPAGPTAPSRMETVPDPAARLPAARGPDQRAVARPEARAEPRPVEPRPEPRTESRQEPRPEPRQDPRAAARPALPPVSAMGQALYGEEAAPARPQAPAARAVLPATPLRPQPPAEPPRPAAVAPVRTPEDILDAARARVLSPASPAAAGAGKRDEAQEFERMLDAQISGDLNRLEPADAPARAPAIEPPRPAGRNEPSLEEEMNRMLSEMGNERKS